MRIQKLAMVISGLTIMAFGFQNCSKARFVIDDAAKEKVLGDTSVFDHGDDGQIAGGNTPGDDGSIAGTNPGNDGSIPGASPTPRPGDDSSMPKFPNMGNDPSMPGFPPGFPRMPGMDPSMPGKTTGGNDPSIPGTSTSGNDPSIPADGSAISVTPKAVCGPSITSGQASLPTATKVVAVLYKSDNFSDRAQVIQAWDAEPDVTNIRAGLAALKPLQLKLSAKLAAGQYSVVMYDAAKVKKPYVYDWTKSGPAIAPIEDTVAHFLQADSVFRVDSNGKQMATQVMNLLVGKEGDAACASAGSIDPLLIQLNTQTPKPIALTGPDQGVMFDLLGQRLDHKKVKTAWFATSQSENYFLVLPNNDGQVLGIDELFGDATMGPDMKFAKQGFAALAKYDDNGDKVISEDDPVFSKLRLWKDDNLDGVVQASELYTLEEKGVVAIDLKYDKRFQETDKYGNMTKFKSVVVTKEGNYGLVYDLYLRYINK